MDLKLLVLLFSLLIYDSDLTRLKSDSQRFQWYKAIDGNQRKDMGMLRYLAILANIFKENQSKLNIKSNFHYVLSPFKQKHQFGRF